MFVFQWVAPNLLTLVALFWIISGALLWASQDGSYEMVFPRWTYVYVAFTVFMYQTFDAIDGKQARRTQTSSPLGQLFDHGCDAINTILALYCYNHAMHFDLNLGYFLLNLSGTVSSLIFLSHLKDYFLHGSMGGVPHSHYEYQLHGYHGCH